MDKQGIRAFFDQLAPAWEQDSVMGLEKIKFILDAADVQPDMRVLDVACGTGILFPFYTQRQIAEVLAVDISPEIVKITKTKAGERIRVVCNDIETMDGTGTYDCCVLYNTFPHFPNPVGLVAYAFSVCSILLILGMCRARIFSTTW